MGNQADLYIEFHSQKVTGETTIYKHEGCSQKAGRLRRRLSQAAGMVGVILPLGANRYLWSGCG
jgi:hypothetical protein